MAYEALEKINLIFRQFAEEKKWEHFQIEENDSCILEDAAGNDFFLFFEENNQRLIFASSLIPLPDEEQALRNLFSYLASANFLGHLAAGGNIGVNSEEAELVYSTSIWAKYLSYEYFLETFEDFTSTALRLKKHFEELDLFDFSEKALFDGENPNGETISSSNDSISFQKLV